MTKATYYTHFWKVLFLISACLTWSSVWSQRESISKRSGAGPISTLLAKLSHSKDDTAKVYLLNDLNERYLEEGIPEKALHYGKEAMRVSRKIGYQKGIAITFTNLGHTYSYMFDNEKALKMYLNALHMNRKLKRKDVISDTYVNIGTIYDDQSNYPMALRYYRKALDSAPKDRDFDLLADIHQNLGITFGELGNHNESLRQHYKALRIYEKINNLLGIADAKNSIGNVYSEKMNFTAALKMYKSSLQLYTRIRNFVGIANENVNIGILLTEHNKMDSVEYYLNKALFNYSHVEDMEGMIITNNALGDAFYRMRKYEQSEKAFLTALEYARSIEDKVETCTANTGLAKVYAESGKVNAARECALKALSISLSIRNKVAVRDSYDALHYVEAKAENFEKAYDYQKLFVAYKDSINNEETTQKGIQIALNYSFQKKEEAQRQANHAAVNKLNLRNQKNRYLIIVLMLILCSALVVGFFARRAYNNRKRYSEVLANENTHKEMLLQEIHHRVNNSLQMISSLLSIQADSTGNEEIREYLLKSENRLQAMSVMHQLLHLGNSKLEVDMNTYFGEVLSFYSNLLESRQNVKLHVNVPSVLFHTKTAMPLAIILNELITNSLKYAFPDDKGEIRVSLQQVDDSAEWIFTVSDNGTGFDESKVPSDAGSLGLSLVNLMIRQIDGELETDASNGTLTRIRFSQRTR